MIRVKVSLWIVWYMDAQTAARLIGGGDWKWLSMLRYRAALYAVNAL